MLSRPHVAWFQRHPLRWLWIPRRDMPQIDEADRTALIEWLAWRSISVTSATLDPFTLRFKQHVSLERIKSMPKRAYESPILVSKDRCVLDGNHRCMAHRLLHEPVPVLIVGLDFQDAVGALFSFAGTYDTARKQRH